MKNLPVERRVFSQIKGNKPLMTFEQFLVILQIVETGHTANYGENAYGDNGQALGPLQIHRACHYDACEHLGINFGYDECAKWPASSLVCYGYMSRYAKKALMRMELSDIEKMCRIWNGGPNGHKKKATEPYWRRFAQTMHKKLKRS